MAKRAVTSLDNRPTTRMLVRALPGAIDAPIDAVSPDLSQPRRDWSSPAARAALDNLVSSVREFGVLQPLVVRMDADAPVDAPRYIVIAGGRRLEAARRGGLQTVPVVVRDGGDTVRQRIMQLTENLLRHSLSEQDEGRAYREIMDLQGISAEELGRSLSVSGQTIRNRLALVERDVVVTSAVERRQITPSAANLILQAPPAQRQEFIRLIKRGDHMLTPDKIRHAIREARSREGAQKLLESTDPATARSKGSEGQQQEVLMRSVDDPAAQLQVETSTDLAAAQAVVLPVDETARVVTPTAATPILNEGIAQARVEPARLLARELASVLWRAIEETQRREFLTRLREIADSLQAPQQSLTLIQEIIECGEQPTS